MDLINSMDYMAYNDIENRLAEMLEDDMRVISNLTSFSGPSSSSSSPSSSSSAVNSNVNSSSSSPNSISFYSSLEEQLSFNTQFLEDFLSLGGEPTPETTPYELACIPPFMPYTDVDQDLFDSSVSCSPNSIDQLVASSSSSFSSYSSFKSEQSAFSLSSPITAPKYNINNEPIIRNLLSTTASQLDLAQHRNQITSSPSAFTNFNSSVKIRSFYEPVSQAAAASEQLKRFKPEPYDSSSCTNNNDINTIQQQQQQQRPTKYFKNEPAFIPMAESSGSFTAKSVSMRPFPPNMKIINRIPQQPPQASSQTAPSNMNVLKISNGDVNNRFNETSESFNSSSGPSGASLKTVIQYTKVYNSGGGRKATTTTIMPAQSVTTSYFEAAARSQSADDKTTGDMLLYKSIDGKIYPKPPYSYSCLTALALRNSDSGTLPVNDIYEFIVTARDGWKNSIRHNLSMNKCFEKIENPKNGSKKGCLWTLNQEKCKKLEEECRRVKQRDPINIRMSMSKPDDLNKIERGEQRIKKLIMSNIKSQQSIANGFAGNSSSSSSSGNENNEAVVSSTSSSSSRKIVNLTKYLNSGDFHT